MDDPFMEKNELDPHTAMICKSEQLLALTTAITGEGFEQFENMNSKLQHNLLHLVADLSHDIYRAVREVSNAEVRHA